MSKIWTADKLWHKNRPKDVAAKPRCELCGQYLQDEDKERDSQRLIAYLALLAEISPSTCVTVVHHLSGRSQNQIASQMSVSQPAISKTLHRARLYAKRAH